MLIIDFPATRLRIKNGCINLSAVAAKYSLNKRSLNLFVNGRYYGRSGHGEVARFEKALIEMKLLVYEEVQDLDQAA